MGKGFRCLSFALIGIALILVGTSTAFAHTWPTGATSTGVTISLTAFRTSDGTTPTGAVLPGTVNQCETIIYRATVGFAGGSNAAIFGGTITITTPDAVVHDVTPAGGVPCLGPSDLLEPNSENCTGTLEVNSGLQPFTLTVASCPATVTASVNYAGGTSHVGASNTPGNSASTSLPITVACCTQDNTVCNGAEFCDPNATFTDPNTGFGRRGTCAAGTPLDCNDNNACTSDSCDPVLGCQHSPVTCNDNNVCTADSCVPATGCVFGTPDACDDNNVCTADSCDPVLGCQHGTPNACDDNNVCTADSCDPVLGCQHGTPNACDDNNPCTDDTCDPVLGCQHTDNGSCVNNEICRTPGFWGTHGGEEKSSSTNITLALLNAYNAANDPDLTVCGTVINNTDLGSQNSALEAICVSPKGDSRLQLGRQLTAAALNCIITKAGNGDICTSLSGAVCGGVSIGPIWAACNAACPTGTTALVDLDNDPLTPDVEVSCIGALDCFNNGGVIDPTDGSCGSAEGQSCHDRDLDNGCSSLSFVPPGAAGSPKECNDSRKNCVSIFGPIPGCS